MRAYKKRGNQAVEVDECEFAGGGIEAVMPFIRFNIEENGATVFEIAPTEPWLQAAHTAQLDDSFVREDQGKKMTTHNPAIGSETFDEIDVEGFNTLTKEDKERVLGIGVRKLWKALHTASVRPNVGCIELAMDVLDGPKSLAAKFCLLAQAYKEKISE
jgi:hypothetical protein